MSIAYYTMTESENIDKIDNAENITVTSDGAFERVISDMKIEEWQDKWYLQQNTAWLVQEIPNISFLDISDTLLESHKTLYGKENWILRVWINAKSIETQPQDIWIFRDVVQDPQNWLWIPSFNTYLPWNNVWNNTCFKSYNIPWVWSSFEIKVVWIYHASYSFYINNISSSATWVQRVVMLRRWGALTPMKTQCYWNVWAWPVIWINDYSASWDAYVELQKDDLIMLAVIVKDANWDYVWWKFAEAEFTLQFQQYKL